MRELTENHGSLNLEATPWSFELDSLVLLLLPLQLL